MMMIGPEQGKKGSGKSGKKKDKAKKAKRSIDVVGETPTVAPVADRPAADGAVTVEAPASAIPPAFGPPLLAWIDRVQEHVDHLLTLTDVPAEAPVAEVEPEVAEPEAAAPRGAAHEVTTPVVADPGAVGSQVTEPEATEPAEAQPEVSEAAELEDAAATVAAAEDEAHRLSLAEAWARRLEAEGEPSEDAVADAAAGPTVEATTDEPTADDGDQEPAWELEPDDDAPAEPAADEPVDDEQFVSELHADEPFEPVAARLSAVLVARELIARGVSPTDVRRRLREGYGVDDPDAVLSRVTVA